MRRHQKCALCGLEVFLTEQLYLEKMVIHKRCFKCSYCEQPLRLNNCLLDRQLQPQFGLRWFCQQHYTLPIFEKINRLERQRPKSITSENNNEIITEGKID